MTDDVTSAGPIERRYGPAAAEEFQVLLNRLDLAEGFVLVVLVVPDNTGARLCQTELAAWLAARNQHLTAITPATPDELFDAATTLLGLPADPRRGAIWLAAATGPWSADYPLWELAWRHVLVGLNQTRNLLRRDVNLPLILAATAALIPQMREIAADLWSVRSLSLRIEPAANVIQQIPERVPRPDRPEPAIRDHAPDPDLAMRMASRHRGQESQLPALASLLSRAGEGFAARRQWQQAEQAWREAAAVYEQTAQPQPTARAWIEIGDIAFVTGRTIAAHAAYGKSLTILKSLAQAEPGRADYQRDLSLAYEREGDLCSTLGQTAAASDAYAKSLAIRENLARANPDRAEYQPDLSVSYNKMGDLYSAFGRIEAARDAYSKALAIRQNLVRSEPDRADYQRELSVSYYKMGDVHRSAGQPDAANDAYTQALGICEALTRAEPGRADYQRDLATAYNRKGDLYSALRQFDAASDAYTKALAIREALARAEPDRADYQRDLSGSYGRMGDLHSALGPTEAARDAYAKALAIAESLVRAEPDRADYQRHLSVSYEKMGDILRALGNASAASEAYAKSLAIAETLARAEPNRADYQRDLVISLLRQASMATGESGPADLQRALGILEALHATGRLAPSDEPMLAAVKEMLTKANEPP
jgi:tetratricopeptide (TPR) repeat protein